MAEAEQDQRLVLVTWYDHDCDWITKYCDEEHVKYAHVPVEVLRHYGNYA